MNLRGDASLAPFIKHFEDEMSPCEHLGGGEPSRTAFTNSSPTVAAP